MIGSVTIVYLRRKLRICIGICDGNGMGWSSTRGHDDDIPIRLVYLMVICQQKFPSSKLHIIWFYLSENSYLIEPNGNRLFGKWHFLIYEFIDSQCNLFLQSLALENCRRGGIAAMSGQMDNDYIHCNEMRIFPCKCESNQNDCISQGMIDAHAWLGLPCPS